MIAVVSEYFLNGNKTPNFLLASLDELFCAPNFCDTSMAWHVYLLSHFFVDGRTRSRDWFSRKHLLFCEGDCCDFNVSK